MRGNRKGCPYVAPAWPCSRWGLPGRPGHPGRRWSLTPPFHPYRVGREVDRYLVWGRIGRMRIPHPLPIHPFTRLPSPNPAVCFCGPIRRVTPPGCYPAPCPVEPGLSSPRACAKRDRLADLEQFHLNMPRDGCQAIYGLATGGIRSRRWQGPNRASQSGRG